MLLALLSFAQYSNVARWKKVEVNTPAGLPAEISALLASVETYPADVMRARAYVRPQFEGWIQGGLAGYQILLQRYTAFRPWDALIVLQYKDDDSFVQRQKVVAKVMARLKKTKNHTNSRFSEIMQRVLDGALFFEFLARCSKCPLIVVVTTIYNRDTNESIAGQHFGLILESN